MAYIKSLAERTKHPRKKHIVSVLILAQLSSATFSLSVFVLLVVSSTSGSHQAAAHLVNERPVFWTTHWTYLLYLCLPRHERSLPDLARCERSVCCLYKCLLEKFTACLTKARTHRYQVGMLRCV